MPRLMKWMTLVVLLSVPVQNIAPAVAQMPADGVHRLVLYISEADMGRMNAVLDVAANVSRHYSGIGEEVEIEVVAYGDGLHMLRADTSPVKRRLDNFLKSMVNVAFQACGNTLDTMARNEGTRPPLIDGITTVQTGVAHLLLRSEEGWTLVRP